MLPHERLDHALNQRRLDLDIEWNDVADGIGISPRSLLDIRKGRNGASDKTARKMDDWLGWKHGSVRELLDGGEPTPLDSARAPAAPPEAQDGEVVHFTVSINPADPEPDFPPGGLRNQTERIIWAMDDPWQVRWSYIQAGREAAAALEGVGDRAAEHGE